MVDIAELDYDGGVLPHAQAVVILINRSSTETHVRLIVSSVASSFTLLFYLL